MRPERILSHEAVLITGLPLRTVQHLAKADKIPGAAMLSSRWTFDEAKLRGWVTEREDATCQRTSIVEDASGARGSGFAARKSDEAYERLLGLRP